MFIIRSNHFWVDAVPTQIASGECVSGLSVAKHVHMHADRRAHLCGPTHGSPRSWGCASQCALLPHTSHVLEGSLTEGQGHGPQCHPGEALTICRTLTSTLAAMCHPMLDANWVPCPVIVLHVAALVCIWPAAAVLVETQTRDRNVYPSIDVPNKSYVLPSCHCYYLARLRSLPFLLRQMPWTLHARTMI